MRHKRGNRLVAASLPFSTAGRAMDANDAHTVFSEKHGASPRLSPGMGEYSGLSAVCGAQSAPASVILPTGGLTVASCPRLVRGIPQPRGMTVSFPLRVMATGEPRRYAGTIVSLVPWMRSFLTGLSGRPASSHGAYPVSLCRNRGTQRKESLNTGYSVFKVL